MKKILCILLAAVIAAGSLVSCGSTLKGKERGAIINMYLSTLPDTFDPSAYALDADTSKIFSLMYMGLTVLGADGKLSGGIAYEWGGYYDSIYEEYRMYFKLRDTCWSDKIPVSADNFAFAWRRILSPKSNSPYAALLFPIKNAKAVKSGLMTDFDLGIKVVDDKRLEIIFEDDYNVDLFAETVANIAFAPLREDKMSAKDWTTKFSITDILSCGPFALRGYNNTYDQRKLELVRNEFYRRSPKDDALDKYVIPYKLVCYYETDDTDLIKAADKFDAGEAFYLSEFLPETYNRYTGKLKSADSLSGYVYYFNTANKLFSDAKVRNALSMAIDRSKVAEIAGCGAVAAGGFVPEGVFDTARGTSFRKVGGDVYPAADTAKAKALLDEAGVRSGSFTITYIDESESDINKQIAEYVAGVWSELGFNVKTDGRPWKPNMTTDNIRSRIDNADGQQFDVFAVDLAMGAADALAYLAPFAKEYSGSPVSVDLSADTAYTPHFTGFVNADYDALADKAVYESDRKAKAELLHQMEVLLAEQCPATALIFYKNSYTASSKLSDYGTYYNGAPTFFKTQLKGWREINKQIEEAEAANNEG